jgi:Uma2 family endonuclease
VGWSFRAAVLALPYNGAMLTAKKRMTLDEFLELPETEPYSEFICGEVVQKSMPSLFHSAIQARLVIFLGKLLDVTRAGWVVTEARHAQRAEGRAYLPDVGVILTATLPKARREFERGPVERVPDFAIEILSPDDRPSRVAEKLAFYLRNNTPLAWVVDPIERTIDAHRPNLPSTTHTIGDIITAEPVLPDFELDLAELFATIDVPG